MIDPTMEKMTDRALGLYGAGIPIQEITAFTGVPKGTIYTKASRSGIRRPRGGFDVATMPMRISAEAIQEAAAYWASVDLPGSARHVEYWNGQLSDTAETHE